MPDSIKGVSSISSSGGMDDQSAALADYYYQLYNSGNSPDAVNQQQNQQSFSINAPSATNSSTSSVDPSNDPTLKGLADSMHMDSEDLHKFMENLLNSITNTIKTDTDQMVSAIKDATKAVEQGNS